MLELQTLLGFDLDEIALVLHNEDPIAEIRRTYHDERTSDDERQRPPRECLALQENLAPPSKPSGPRSGLSGRP